MKQNIIDDLNKIILDIEHYKNKKDIIRFIIRLENIIENSKNDIFIDILNKFITKITNEDISNEQLKIIEKTLFGFLVRNEKLYITKKKVENNVVYEYKDYYSLYIKNKDIKIIDFIENNFKDKKILSINIDGVKWNNISNITSADIQNSKDIKIDIKK